MEDLIGEAPVVIVLPAEDFVDRRAVAKMAQAQFADELKVGPPHLVMAGVAQLIDAHAVGDLRAGAFNAHAEHESQRIDGICCADAWRGGRLTCHEQFLRERGASAA